MKAVAENGNNNDQEQQRKSSISLASVPVIEHGCVKPGTDVGNAEIEYFESENLNDLDDIGTTLKGLLSGLESKDWVLLCETLNNARRLSLFHKETMVDLLEEVITLLVKSLKNPRSAVCKTALMTSTDLFNAYNDQYPLLVQILLKASQDKKFVCEAAERALAAMSASVSPSLLLPKLQPYLKNKNPRIRAKASMCFSGSVPHMGLEGIKSHGIDNLIQVDASQLSDQLPESRGSSRSPHGITSCPREIPRFRTLCNFQSSKDRHLGALLPVKPFADKCPSCSPCDEYHQRGPCDWIITHSPTDTQQHEVNRLCCNRFQHLLRYEP